MYQHTDYFGITWTLPDTDHMLLLDKLIEDVNYFLYTTGYHSWIGEAVAIIAINKYSIGGSSYKHHLGIRPFENLARNLNTIKAERNK